MSPAEMTHILNGNFLRKYIARSPLIFNSSLTLIYLQITKFVSYHPDPDAFAVDAFSIDWNGLKFYAFPPFSCVGKMLRKIYADKHTGL